MCTEWMRDAMMDAFDDNEVKFQIPGGMILGGASSSGKTTLLLKILDNYEQMFEPVPQQIVYAYGQYHGHVPQLQARGITVHSGPPSDEFLAKCKKPLLLVLDDLMLSVSEEYLSELYTKKNHHEQIFTIFVTQNVFDKKIEVARTNSQYILLTRAPNAINKIHGLGKQLFRGHLKDFMEAYDEATHERYGYLLIDMHAGSSPSLMLRTNIFPDEFGKVFIP